MVDAVAEEGCRPAVTSDLDRLAVLAEQAVTELAAGRGGALWARHQGRLAPFAPRLAQEIDAADHEVVVGTLDGDVLGYGVAHVEVLRDGGLLGVVTDLYAEPDAREVGLGEAMMSSLIEWCTGRGCFGVDSLALPGDRHTKNFFESFGLVARALVVHRPLP